MITARSYCTGYTGLEMAVRAAFGDFEVLSHSDIKPAARALLDHHYPHIPNLGDMKALFPADPDEPVAELEHADLFIGSWPCQPHSSAGRRLGEEDPRDLWPNYIRGIRETRPKVFFGENVARIATNGELRRVVRSLAELGYVGAWRVLGASDVGGCHQRKRCFVVAVDASAADAPGLGHADLAQRGDPAALPVGSIAGSSTGDRAGRTPPRVRELGRAPGVVDPGRGPAEVHAETDRLSLLPTPSTRNGNGSDQRGRSPGAGGIDLQTAVTYLPTPCANDHKGPGPLDRRPVGDDDLATRIHRITTNYLPTPSVADSRNTRNATAGRSEGQEHHHSGWTLCDVAHADRWGKYAAAIDRHEQALGRTAPAPTSGATKAGNPLLAARFVEWMMMLPEEHVTGVPGLTRTQQLSLLGDGVVPAQGAAAFSFLLDHLTQRLASERVA